MNDPGAQKQQIRRDLAVRWAELWPGQQAEPRPPLFPSVGKAAQRLRSLPEYRLARTICVMPDPVLLQARINALQDGKLLLAATPGLKQGLVRLSADMVPVTARSRDLRGGALAKAGKPLRLPEDSPGKVDLVLGGAMAADARGTVLGDGRGLLDLCLAVLGRVGALSKTATLVLLLADEQVLADDLPAEPWDAPAGILLTPGGAVRTGAKLPRPPHWGPLPPRLAGLPLVRAVEGS